VSDAEGSRVVPLLAFEMVLTVRTRGEALSVPQVTGHRTTVSEQFANRRRCRIVSASARSNFEGKA
jgi:hypothetical protein